MKKKRARTLSLILFYIGILLGLALSGSLTWADLEANFYFGYGVRGTHRLKLSCPLIITATETNKVTASVSNTADRPVAPIFNVDISKDYVFRTERSQLEIAAGKTETISWEVTPGDVVFGHLILVQVYQFQAFTLPSADDKCGILVINLPKLNGTQVYILAVMLGLLSLTGGLILWIVNNRSIEGRILLQMRGMVFLAGVVVLGIVASSLGAWGLGILLAVITVLMIGIITGRFIQGQ